MQRKEKALKEIKCFSSECTNDKQDEMINTAEREKLFVVGIGDQTSHCIHFLKPKPHPDPSPGPLQFCDGRER